MHGGIVMTMNEKERGMKCGRIHRNRRVMLPIPAFMRTAECPGFRERRAR